MNIVRQFQLMAGNNAWANYRLAKAMMPLSHEDYMAKRVSFFPSLYLTLNHILTVDWYYYDALIQGGIGRRVFDDPAPCKTLIGWAEKQEEIDQKLIQFCLGLSEKDLIHEVGIERRHGMVNECVAAVLNHLFLHQTHHRGQVHAMLAGTNIALPQLDEFYLCEDISVRAHELKSLGLDEHCPNV